MESVDYLIVGAGVAGLRAAIGLAEHGSVLVVTKEALGESNTHYAQGGIAVAMGGEDDLALHLKDTEDAGDGLVFKPAAQVLVSEGPRRVEELMAWGAQFDRLGGKRDGELLLAREAAHSLPRILHAHGDATGAEISRSLLAYAQQLPRIQFADWTMLAGVVAEGGRAIATDLFLLKTGETRRVGARAILIASGGAGQVYSDTTNPEIATGDGIALSALAGAELADMEFYQFHPTALALPGVPRFLLSEALRGEGAYLRNDRGERFMERHHPLMELAPRDVVARAIAQEGLGLGPDEPRPVYLDLRHVGIDLTARFPGISRFLAQHGLSLAADLIPVRPAAHYLMGGIRTDLWGRTSLRGLYAAGEAACTGVHGANRLASNSLLEGLVFGAKAAEAMLADGLEVPSGKASVIVFQGIPEVEAKRLEALISRLQASMWANAGLLRERSTLRQGVAEREAIQAEIIGLHKRGLRSRRLLEAQALTLVAEAIQLAALAREESRGAHFRRDFPKRDDGRFQRHSVSNAGEIRFQSL